MCIIIAKPQHKQLTEETLKNCFDNNSDGAGFAYAKDSKLYIKKGFFTLEEFLEAYNDYQELPCLLHFRIATHGNIDKERCHPFRLDDELCVAHNGVLRAFTPNKKSPDSDTLVFLDAIVKPLIERDRDLLHVPAFQRLLEETIGYNKLAFLNNYGKFTIINKSAGKEEDDVWFSNTTYKFKKHKKYYFPKNTNSESNYYYSPNWKNHKKKKGEPLVWINRWEKLYETLSEEKNQ